MLLLSPVDTFAQPSFEKDVQPIFEANCFSCHGGTVMLGLDLRTVTSLLKGSHEGPVVVSGSPKQSRLHEKLSMRLMPPPAFNLRLTDNEIDIVRQWIEAGLPSDEGDAIATKTKDETERFKNLALPIFKARCLSCHGTDNPAGGLDLRTLTSVLKGSSNGPVLSELGSGKSILMRKISAGDMPPPGTGDRLSEIEQRTLAHWIDTSDLRLLRPHFERTKFNQAEAPPISKNDRSFWAFQKPLATVPSLKSHQRIRTPIDAFLLARLKEENLSFSKDAPKITLMRRAWLDLIGLPPSLTEIKEFLGDKKPRAYERLIDRLLDSPLYGERWGRHWLDAAGYSDEPGFATNNKTATVSEGMWRYRDWVIQAFNKDIPYDQFLIDQLAGDELVDWRSAKKYTPEIRDKLTATGYLRAVYDRTDSDIVNLIGERYDVLFHLMEKISTGLMGLTVGCARCHSHKYDPISQKDYYQMLAIFASAYNPAHWLQPKHRFLPNVSKIDQEEIENHNAEIDKPVEKLKKQLKHLHKPYREQFLETKLKEIPEKLRIETKEAVETLKDERDEVQIFLASKFEEQLTISSEELVKALNVEDRLTHDRIEKQIYTLNGYRRSWDRIQALWDPKTPPKIRLLQRGEIERPGPTVEPGFLEVLSPFSESKMVRPKDAKGETSGYRLAFARWLTHKNHPLTVRVFVNRIWQHHFGRGIVETPDNFGRQGMPPTHPALLDWLAIEFMRQNWSIKNLHRLIMTSTAYRQSSKWTTRSPGDSIDPENKLLWRMNLRRLEAETLRDSILSVSGKLDLTMGGPPMEGPLLADGLERIQQNLNDPTFKDREAKAVGMFRRSIYVLARRYVPLTFLETFDAPLMQTNCNRRVNSVSPLQSLTLMNNDFVLDSSRFFANRVESLTYDGTSVNDTIEKAYLLALSRFPLKEELQIAKSHLDREKDLYLKSNASEEKAQRAALESFCHLLFLTNEFLYNN